MSYLNQVKRESRDRGYRVLGYSKGRKLKIVFISTGPQEPRGWRKYRNEGKHGAALKKKEQFETHVEAFKDFKLKQKHTEWNLLRAGQNKLI